MSGMEGLQLPEDPILPPSVDRASTDWRTRKEKVEDGLGEEGEEREERGQETEGNTSLHNPETRSSAQP